MSGAGRSRTGWTSFTRRSRRNRVWTVVGRAGSVVTLAAAVAICAALAARIDGPDTPARDAVAPPPVGGNGWPGPVEPVARP